MNTDPLSCASHERIQELRELEDHHDPRIRSAAIVAVMALLAIRDQTKRPQHPEIYNTRLSHARDEINQILNQSTPCT